ncbi:type IV toxin-antitoxin system AbiEi family antitoxin domain-containing protein [Actinopolyspora saharensis]|uniref:type IV toxin-antitoxin system AbiEi family antitoxin domain-containing protein n=1 Tax=Actinopolyspora saharensis TaxID=995062 RepID=UPI003F663D74
MKTAMALKALGDYSAGQWGMVTSAQARRAGIDTVTLTRLVEQGLLVRPRRGAYAVAAAEEAEHTDIKAAWLALNPSVPAWERLTPDTDGGVVSHRSAATLHDLGELVAEDVEMIVPRRRNPRDPSLRLRKRAVAESDVTLVDGLPVTTIERTVVDLLEEHVDASHVGPIVHDAARDGRLDLNRLAPRIGGYSRRYGFAAGDGRALLDHLLDHVSADSPSERVLAEILRSFPEVYEEARRNVCHTAPLPDSAPGAESSLPDLTEARMAPVRRALNAVTRSKTPSPSPTHSSLRYCAATP